MRGFHRLELEEFGLSSPEAQVYLALLRSTGGLGASAVANTTGIQRTGIYPILDFDRQSVLMPLVAPSGQGGTLFIRHPQVAMSLGMLFDSFWERGKPFPASCAKRTKDKEVTKTAAASSKLLLTPRRRSTNSQPHFLGQKVHC